MPAPTEVAVDGATILRIRPLGIGCLIGAGWFMGFAVSKAIDVMVYEGARAMFLAAVFAQADMIAATILLVLAFTRGMR